VRQSFIEIPEGFSRGQNYPNPFNPSTIIRYELSKESYVNLVIFDILGREVKTLVDAKQESGRKTVSFDASKLPGGVYFYRLIAGKFKSVKKMVLIR